MVEVRWWRENRGARIRELDERRPFGSQASNRAHDGPSIVVVFVIASACVSNAFVSAEEVTLLAGAFFGSGDRRWVGRCGCCGRD